MSHIASMVQAIDFIENNLKEAITIADVAEAVSSSLYHFCRMFNRFVHHTPYDYLIRRRLSESARELLETDKKIIDIALDYQFNNPETFSRAFKRMFDMQPNQWKRQNNIGRRFLLPRLTAVYLQHINKGDYLKPVLVKKEAFCLAGVMTLVVDEQPDISALWKIFKQELAGLADKVKPQKYYGLTSYPQDTETGGYFYMAAIEVDPSRPVGPALVVKTLPPLKYARFIHKGLYQERKLTLDYIYQTWLPKSGQSLAYPLEIECYEQDFSGAAGEEVESKIYIPLE
ncbi:MAG: AraC family transcriptional regulator [Anaerolineae bacterium]|nr:AraC family transcriptional regulator [Anaerolineae bacterium]